MRSLNSSQSYFRTFSSSLNTSSRLCGCEGSPGRAGANTCCHDKSFSLLLRPFEAEILQTQLCCSEKRVSPVAATLSRSQQH